MGNTCKGGSTTADDVFVVPQAGVSIPVRTVKKLGWKRDYPDFRDRVLALPAAKKANLPSQVDLRKKNGGFPIYDQGDLGSCTANALCAAFHFSQVNQGLEQFVPSRLFVYFNERSMEGTVDSDSGAYIRDGVKAMNKLGVCKETDWVYDVSKFTLRPGDACYSEALKNTVKEYARVPQTMEDIKACIAEGFPIVFGFAVCSSFFSAEVQQTGMMPMPQPGDYVLGGHAVQACGYDDEKRVVIVRNSWGEGWGDAGFFYMPYDYISDENLCADFWAIRFVDGIDFPTTTSTTTSTKR